MKTKKLELTNDQNYFLYWILSENDCSDWVNEFFNWHDFRILLNKLEILNIEFQKEIEHKESKKTCIKYNKVLKEKIKTLEETIKKDETK